MAAYTLIPVIIGVASDDAVVMIFHEGLPEEEETWIPKSCIHEDYLDVILEPTADSVEVGIKKWLLQKKGIDYSEGEDLD